MIFFDKKEKVARQVSADILARLDDAVVVIDSYHEIIVFNQAAEKMFGYAASEVVDRRLDVLFSEEEQADYERRIESLYAAAAQGADAVVQRDILFRRKDGAGFSGRVLPVQTQSGGNSYLSLVIQDATSAKKDEDEILRLASTDVLTGAYNRREFLSLAEREIGRAVRYDHPVSVLMLDIDHFRRINDSYGHAAGDKVLQRLVSLCQNSLRNVDIFGRWDGGAFVALLPETDAEGAGVIAERLRRVISENVLTVQDHKISFTASIGVAGFKSGDIGIDPALGRADSAVYDAKKAGRDRISVFRG